VLRLSCLPAIPIADAVSPLLPPPPPQPINPTPPNSTPTLSTSPQQSSIDELKQQVAREQARRDAERAAERAKKAALKEMLEGQMKDNAVRRVVAPMSETEKLINSQVRAPWGWVAVLD